MDIVFKSRNVLSHSSTCLLLIPLLNGGQDLFVLLLGETRSRQTWSLARKETGHKQCLACWPQHLCEEAVPGGHQQRVVKGRIQACNVLISSKTARMPSTFSRSTCTSSGVRLSAANAAIPTNRPERSRPV